MKSFVVVFAMVLLMPFAAYAERGACKEDIAKFCADVKAGEGRLAACLMEHKDELSEGCKKQAKADFKKYLEISADCATDVQEHCADVEPGEGRIAKCLAEHEGELEKACKAHVEKAKQAVDNLKDAVKACKKDIKAYCAEVKPGGGAVLECLKAAGDKVSAECQAKLPK